MNAESRTRFSVAKLEWGAAAFLVLLIVALHVMTATSAGGLWRDEANSVALSNFPSVADVWNNLRYDSFPFLWPLILRGFTAVVGPMNDTAIRAAGFVIGIGVMAALWLNAKVFGHRIPLVSLLLLGLSPSMIRWGDSIRAYGFGILLMLVTSACLWRFVEKPGRGRFVVCLISAIASVNVLYYNAVMLFALCAGGVAVCVWRRSWKTAAAVVLIGALAAVSLATSLPSLRTSSEWVPLVRMNQYNLAWFLAKIGEALAPAGPAAAPLWIGLVTAASIAGAIAVVAPRRVNITGRQREVILFAFVSLVVGSIGIFVFLRALSYYTAPWYYLALLALVAVMTDAILGTIVSGSTARGVRAGGAVLLAVAMLIPTRQAVRQRMTDVDLIANDLEARAEANDLIVVTPWHFGISFTRYYTGKTPWVSVPMLRPLQVVRYDTVARLMTLPDQRTPAKQVTDRIKDALERGNTVYVAGGFPDLGENELPNVLPPAPWKNNTWDEGAHEKQWDVMVRYFLKQHSISRTEIPINVDRVVSSYERVTVSAYEGWKP